MCYTYRDIIRYFSAVASGDPVVETELEGKLRFLRLTKYINVAVFF